MNSQYSRIELLLSQGRHELAERETRQLLGQNPDDALAHSLLAICIGNDTDRQDEATREAQMAVAIEPDSSFSHYVLSQVLASANQLSEAYQSINEAISLDPYDADYFAHASMIRLQQRNWEDALKHAEQGLAINPESNDCNNLRTIALERLGRTGDAVVSAEENLKNAPDNSYAHSAHGYALLNDGKHREAQVAFREALRLDPNNPMARSGMMDAISSKNILFRLMNRYERWMSRLAIKYQFALILGAWLLIQVLASVESQHPWIGPLIPVIIMAYICFAVLTWTSDSIFNTLLRFHSFGRHLLTPKLIWRSNLIASFLISGMSGIVYCGATGLWGMIPGVFFYWTLLCVPVTMAFAMPAINQSLLIAAIGCGVALLPVYGVINYTLMGGTAAFFAQTFKLFTWGIILMQVLGGSLIAKSARR